MKVSSMEQSLVQKVELTPDEFFREIVTPSVDVVLIGEDHYNKAHKENERKIVEKVIASQRPFRLVLENFAETDAALFAEAYRSREAREKLEHMIRERTMGNFHMAYVDLALQHGREILPIDPFPFEKFDLDEKNKHMAKRLNGLSQEVLTIAILGMCNLTYNVFQRYLAIPDAKRKEVLQNTDFAPGIFKIPDESHRYYVNREI